MDREANNNSRKAMRASSMTTLQRARIQREIEWNCGRGSDCEYIHTQMNETELEMEEAINAPREVRRGLVEKSIERL